MRRGRKPLDPEVQAERRRESRLRYESQHLEERREAARLRMRRHREVISNSGYKIIESYRRQARQSAAKYRERHPDKLAAVATNQPQRNAASQQKGTMKSSKPSKQKGTTKSSEPSKESIIMKSSKASKTHQRVSHVARKQRTVHSDGQAGQPCGNDGSDDSDSGDDWIDEHRDFNQAKWDFKNPPQEVFLPCGLPGCPEDACPGCACVCSATNVWIKHWGGHNRSPPRGSIFG
ncbi:hypothetical protein B0H19DRAFT_1073627 [Mycena capillaripes]|nr:hypothetical protein B0H19DRAFT_1073627 [Mycena capillaripes]